MNKVIFIIIVMLFLYGCSSHLDKKIFEPLTVEEIKKSIDQDSIFEDTYKAIQFVKDSILISDLEKAKFADLTYERVYKLVKFSQDSNYFKPIRENLKKDWQVKYGVLHQKVDSISNYWKKLKNENSLDQYVKIELVEIDKEYYSYSYGIKNINLGFRLTPLKGKVDQVRFGYRLEAKINDKGEERNQYESIYTSFDKSWCLATSPFSSPVVRYWEANYSNEKILEGMSLETFLRDYNIYIEVDEIRKDGKNMSIEDLKIPESVVHHWRYENNESLKDLYVSDILKELLDVEYKPDYEYISLGVEEMLKAKDALAYEFLTATARKK